MLSLEWHCNNDLCFCVLHLKLWMLAIDLGTSIAITGIHTFIRVGSYKELLGRCGRHSTELRGLYFHPLGRCDEEGEALVYEGAPRETMEPVRLYLQELKGLIRHLGTYRTNVMLSN